ncbi:hypothetical protein M0802_002319 [Mischocyttarus mexicanus]|nr:hypothetical protein M0802_002319 [Mischocyttarus mexicanus]
MREVGFPNDPARPGFSTRILNQDPRPESAIQLRVNDRIIHIVSRELGPVVNLSHLHNFFSCISFEDSNDFGAPRNVPSFSITPWKKKFYYRDKDRALVKETNTNQVVVLEMEGKGENVRNGGVRFGDVGPFFDVVALLNNEGRFTAPVGRVKIYY